MFSKAPIIVLVFIAAAVVFAPFFTQYDPVSINLDEIKAAPSLSHPFGTDCKGRDVLARVLYGGRISLGVSFAAALVSLCIGFSVGLISGYYGGWTDTLFMAVVDLTLAFPSLLLAIGISVVLPPTKFTVMAAIALVGWASFARLIRGQVLKVKEMAYVEAARSLGAGNLRVIAVHIFPQCLSLGLVILGIKFSGYILTEASLSFLGLGPQPPTPSWGNMIGENRAYILSEPWMVLFPGLAIAATALCFNLFGDYMQEKFSNQLDRQIRS
ncbi:ABC transporter permease [Candidatus Magnetominusculus xianensis]|uniref:ABC-type dipeptide/oligopeptide/nickel transport system, permease component n=1 Tax=Candidatus Magnetominusculus xianensis TaxID=1748249 RepID=A0ABR5SGE5_9BACT|nr:ABC transporter permease [Candidatus Magnetominusculus xianensis]KWT89418.1 ABC-type dipeptide/oligopeptide/nickel transport system, permease component [Candidatus Magnetominusculus xianensis]MBF0405507.1 ABC transporter permease [Nitrospirota bacterium]